MNEARPHGKSRPGCILPAVDGLSVELPCRRSCLFRKTTLRIDPIPLCAAFLALSLSSLVLADDKPAKAPAALAGWKHAGSVFVLTTPEGANLPAGSAEEGFPLLVRLHKDSFPFTQAKANGDDLRFATPAGALLPYQIEHWDPIAGEATVWVRLPRIKGNDRQEIKLHWGNPDAASESSGKAVFNESNGYVAVFHMNGPVKDETGRLETKDTGTSDVAGMVGPARHFPGKKGIFCGDKISGLPTGAGPNTTEAWLRSQVANGRVLGWGNEAAQGKVILNYRSPPHIRMECYFSGADVAGKTAVQRFEWVHVMHTYQKGESLLYVNGVLDGVTRTTSAPLNVKSPARMWIGGWYDNYDFAGDVDEVRISNVIRSADWVKLQFENQKPLQTLTGHLVQPGDALTVSPAQLSITEGKSAVITAQAGGAQKVYWIHQRGGQETIASSDRLNYTFDAGRVSGDQAATLQFKAVYANEVKTRDIQIAIKEEIPDPIFTLTAPATWDGRATIEVVPRVTNLDAMKASGAGELALTWSIGDLAVTKETQSGKLILTRAQNSGKLRVAATIHNGGAPVTQTVFIDVKEPAKDAWIARTPDKDEKPQDNQFFARDDKSEGTLHCNGTLEGAVDSVFLRVTADDQPFGETSAKLGADKAYALAIKLKPGLVKYKAVFGSKTGDKETVLHTASNLVCGDAYLINGQSNAVATDFGKEDPAFRSDWIRTFGSMSGNPVAAKLWGNAVHRSRDAEKLAIGYWGMELGRRLVENHKVPICLINGAVGGTRIDQHQRNEADPTDMSTIYGRLLWRTQQAKLTHGIRGILWHQGENDQGADGPTGGYGYETYRQYFIDLAAAWKRDYPNVQHYYVFQIWPKSCSMGVNGSDNRLREVQRQLPTAFSRLSVMSTLGIDPPGGCHFPAAGYAEFARFIVPLIERDHYGKVFAASITPPNLKRASYTSDAKDEIAMEFDQPVKWDNSLAGQFYLDGEKGKVVSGTAAGNRVTLKLSGPSTAGRITYLDSKSWSQATLLRGENGIAALTFCDVPIDPRSQRP